MHGGFFFDDFSLEKKRRWSTLKNDFTLKLSPEGDFLILLSKALWC